MKHVPLGRLRAFYVITPTYDTYSPSECDPGEQGADVALICARTKHRAKVLAVRSWRRSRRRNYVRYYHGENPFTGLKVEEVTCHTLREDS